MTPPPRPSTRTAPDVDPDVGISATLTMLCLVLFVFGMLTGAGATLALTIFADQPITAPATVPPCGEGQ